MRTIQKKGEIFLLYGVDMSNFKEVNDTKFFHKERMVKKRTPRVRCAVLEGYGEWKKEVRVRFVRSPHIFGLGADAELATPNADAGRDAVS